MKRIEIRGRLRHVNSAPVIEGSDPVATIADVLRSLDVVPDEGTEVRLILVLEGPAGRDGFEILYNAQAQACSLCGVQGNEVSRMIRGAFGQVCDECIVLAHDILAPEDEEEREQNLKRLFWDNTAIRLASALLAGRLADGARPERLFEVAPPASVAKLAAAVADALVKERDARSGR